MQEMKERQGRFADTWTEVIAAEAAVIEQRRIERCYRQMLAMTDAILTQLEQRNLAGQRDLDGVLRRHIDRTLAELPPRARCRFPEARTVQRALDGIFEVQEELLVVLQRMLHWDRLLSAPWDGRADDDGEGEVASRRTA
jgi:hypothetical protein